MPAPTVASETYLAVDLGGTTARTQLFGARERTCRVTWDRLAGIDRDHTVLCELLRTVTRDAGPVAGVGLASAPGLDATGVVTGWPNRPWWRGFPLVATVRDAVGAPVHAVDDGALAALAEATATMTPDLLYLGLGTGVGSGAVVAGHPSPLADGLGHRVIDPTGLPCVCGRRGCLQTLVSAAPVAARAARLLGEPVTPAMFIGHVWAGSPPACEVVEEMVQALAAAVRGCGWCGPVVVGGGFGAAVPGLAGRLGAALPGQPVTAARNGADSSLAGARIAAVAASADN